MTHTPHTTSVHRAWEVRGPDGRRVAYLPPPPRPGSPTEALKVSREAQQRARTVAAALTHLDRHADSVSIRDDGHGTLSAWDGPIRLLDVTYEHEVSQPESGVRPQRTVGSQESYDRANLQISSFVDGYIIARGLCLGLTSA